MPSSDRERSRLAGVAVRASGDLRQLAADLTAAFDADMESISISLVVRARDVALRHGEGLRNALKHPAADAPKVQRMNKDLPCWLTIEGDR
jgi:hypothetical protein